MPWPLNRRVPMPAPASELRLVGPGPVPVRLGFSARVRGRLTGADWVGIARDTCYVVLTAAGWLLGNLLSILGCTVALFIIISHGQTDAFFLHVDNLASRYVAADLGRKAAFEHQLVQLFSIILVATLAIRGPRFVARLRRELAEGRAA